MRTVTVNNFIEFLEETGSYDLNADLVLFRGQPRSGNLLPCIARKDPAVDTVEIEKETLRQLGLMGASHVAAIGPNQLELMVIAQHYGLKTRLLDWTGNPLAALWFACSSPTKSDVYVYALEADGLLVNDVYETDPFAVAKTRVFQPKLNNNRILAQHGWFTLHRYSKKGKRFVPLEQNSDTKPRLIEVRIPANRRRGILEALDRHGVGYRTLFPDLVGLCDYLNWKYKLL